MMNGDISSTPGIKSSFVERFWHLVTEVGAGIILYVVLLK